MFTRLALSTVVLAALAVATAEIAPVAPSATGKEHKEAENSLNGRVLVDEPSAVVEETAGNDVNGGKIFGFDAPSGGFINGFIATLCVIIVSELGDKTFFIAAIMAMRHSRLTVVTGAISALAIMHVMSALFGALALKIIPKTYTFYISSFLFAIFGLKMLKEAYEMKPEVAQEEMEEVREELSQKEAEEMDVERGNVVPAVSTKLRVQRLFSLVFSPIFIQAFTMTFLAEWGDRSQLATIVLAAREDITAVIIAGILGHSLCTGLAVIGGRFIAQKISVKTVTYVGGIVFLIFAMTAFFMDPNAA